MPWGLKLPARDLSMLLQDRGAERRRTEIRGPREQHQRRQTPAPRLREGAETFDLRAPPPAWQSAVGEYQNRKPTAAPRT
jgi:hypothetical protein